MTKVARIDFYTIEMPKNSNSRFEDFLKQVYALPENDRTQTVNSTPVRLQRLVEVDNLGEKFLEGEIVRIRMSGLPSIAGLQGGVEDLNLPVNKGLGEQTAFLYHPATKTLLFHATQVGVSIPSFLRYFEILGGSVLNLFQAQIFADPILVKDALQRLAKMKSIRTFEYRLRVAEADNMEFLEDQGLSVKQEIDLMNKYKAPSIGLKLSVEHLKNDSLDTSNTQNTVKSLLRWEGKHPGDVSKIRLSGADEDNEAIHIKNLLKETMRETIKLQIGQERSIPYSVRCDALRRAWQRRQDEIFSFKERN